MTIQFFKVTITPLHYENEYGDEVDVTADIDISDFIAQSSLGSIKREIDNGDFDVGVFVFGEMTLRCLNDRGRFNEHTDPRSMFRYKRDLAIVKILINVDGVESVLFEGLVNEDATKMDVDKHEVKLKVLSLDSIFRQVKVAGGAVAAGILFSDAIKQILNTTAITSILNYDPLNINLDVDLKISDGDVFSNESTKDVLDELLLASNSILYIDENRNIIVTDRVENPATFYLYGVSDPLGRENIIKINAYNSGIQRSFSSVIVNESEITDEAYVDIYGFRQKSVSFQFTAGTVEVNQEEVLKDNIIAQRILDEFKVPRPEMEVTVLSNSVTGIKLLDQVFVDFNHRYAPADGEKYVKTVNTIKIGDTLPHQIGSLRIEPNKKWKVVSIQHNLRNYTTKLKLRHTGKVIGEGYV